MYAEYVLLGFIALLLTHGQVECLNFGLELCIFDLKSKILSLT